METALHMPTTAVEPAERPQEARSASVEARTDAAAQPALAGQRSLFEKAARALTGVVLAPLVSVTILLSLIPMFAVAFAEIIKPGSADALVEGKYAPLTLATRLAGWVCKLSGLTDTNPAVLPEPAAPTAEITPPVLAPAAPVIPPQAPAASAPLDFAVEHASHFHRLAVYAADGDEAARAALARAAETSPFVRFLAQQSTPSLSALQDTLFNSPSEAERQKAHRTLSTYHQRFGILEADAILKAARAAAVERIATALPPIPEE